MEFFHKLDGVLPTPEEMDRQLREAAERRKASWDRLKKRADSIRVVDFHVHTFPETIAARALEQLSRDSGSRYFTDGTVRALRESMQEAGVDLSVVLPVITNPAKVAHINLTAAGQNEQVDETGILSFAGIHPAAENYRVLLRQVKELGFKGIKLHPDYYGIMFDDPRTLRIIDLASELDLIIITHAGTDIGLYPPVCCTVDSIVRVMDTLAPPKLVAAHMGGWNNWDEVLTKLAGRPLWVDTAFSIGEIEWLTPQDEKYGFRQLPDGKFVELVHAMGVDRVLFASDSPWAEQKDYVNRISAMPLTEEEKEKIFGTNAKKLLGLDEPAE